MKSISHLRTLKKIHLSRERMQPLNLYIDPRPDEMNAFFGADIAVPLYINSVHTKMVDFGFRQV